MDGSFSTSRSSLVIASSDPHQFALATCMSAKSAYFYLLSANFVPPHCEEKFLPSFGSLYWVATSRQLFFFSLDRPVIDLSWKVAHGVLYTADRLISFGYAHDPNCFCGATETAAHLFFELPLAWSVFGCLHSLLFRFSSLSPSLPCRHALFGFSSSELRVVPPVCVNLLMVVRYFFWRARNGYRIRDVPPGAISIIECVKARVKFHLPLFFKRFRSSRLQRFFHHQWGANGIVSSVEDGRFYLRL